MNARRHFVRLAEPERQHVGSPMPSLATSRICDATSARTAGRAVASLRTAEGMG